MPSHAVGSLRAINQLVQFRLLGLHLDRLADMVTAVPETDAAAPQSLDVKGAIKVRDLSFRYGARASRGHEGSTGRRSEVFPNSGE
jgi:ABC-type bacteriocin/lantibiotic exporter with double-glycine peptidase domain